jgi:citrate lyase subunit beta / citryl-CoA lyase
LAVRGGGGVIGALEPVPRTWLFTPADDPRKLARAVRSGAEVVIADLEDSVAPERKEAARQNASAFITSTPEPASARRIVRISDPRSEAGRLDLERLGYSASETLMVPKACSDSLERVHRLGLRAVALVETAHGLAEVERIAAHVATVAVAIGTVDLAAELGLGELPDGLELLYARSRVVLACSLAGIPAIDGPLPRLGDRESLQSEALRARALGFAAKLCIHPDHVEMIRDAFTPSAEEVAHARRIIDSYERSLAENRGVTRAGDEMVDVASVRRAQRTLARVDTHL